jgi:hypothetical protein
MRANPAWADAQRRVDNRFGRPVERVKMFGKVEFSLDTHAEAVAFVWRELTKRAEKISVSRTFLRSFRIFADGVVYQDPQAVPLTATDVRIYPDVPYALKVERGQGRAPKTGIFRIVARMAKAKYSAGAYIDFEITVPKNSQQDKVGRKNYGITGVLTQHYKKVKRPRKRRGNAQEILPVPQIRIVRGGNFR